MDADDKPIAGAVVTAYAEGIPRYIMFATKMVQAGAKATTKEDGAFAFDVRAEGSSLLVVAEKAGLGIGWALHVPQRGDRAEVVRLVRSSTLAGTVVDEAGKPIGGATVSAAIRPDRRSRTHWWLDGTEGIDALVTRTDAAGRFAFDNIPEGASADFSAESPGRAAVQASYGRGAEYAAPAKDVKLVLGPEAKIEVTAVDKATSRPAGNVAIAALPWRGTIRLATCVSKAQGRYLFEGLSGGQYTITLAVPTRGVTEWAAIPTRVDAQPGKTATAKLELVRGGLLEVAVTDAEDGKPIRDAFVDGWNQRLRSPAFAIAGPDGVARMRVPPGDYRIGWINARGYSSLGSAASAAIVEGKTGRIAVALNKTPKVRGVVTDAAGRPLAGAMLCVLPEGEYAATDSAGRFAIEADFRRWSYLTSFVLVARYAEGNLAAAVDIKDAAKALDLKLAPALTVGGKVVGAGGAPLAGAEISILIGDSMPEVLPALTKTVTGPDGRFEINALPAGRTYTLRASVRGYSVVDLPMTGASAQGGRIQAADIALHRADLNAPAPVIKALPIPEIPGEWAIWGATGRDSRGHIWFSVTAHEIPQPSAHLFEYDPKADKVIDRGDVVSQLKQAGVYRQGEGQMKIHSKIIQAGDGHLYFVSMDEDGEDEKAEKVPTWGSHLWQLRLSDNRWEHLLSAPEGLIALAVAGRHVYAFGYWQHVLYQYDIETGKSRSVKVGAIAGHVSRNILADGRGHVYVPRVKAGADGGPPTATLVEFDAALKELSETPLRHYFHYRPADAHGITGFQAMPDGSMVFLTHNGWMSRIQPGADGDPAKVTDIGWLHPSGPTYVASLFGDSSGRCLMAAVERGWRSGDGGGYEWVVYDLKTGAHSTAAMKVADPKDLSLRGALLYGSQTRDDDGNCYVVGGASRGLGRGMGPLILKVAPARIADQ